MPGHQRALWPNPSVRPGRRLPCRKWGACRIWGASRKHAAYQVRRELRPWKWKRRRGRGTSRKQTVDQSSHDRNVAGHSPDQIGGAPDQITDYRDVKAEPPDRIAKPVVNHFSISTISTISSVPTISSIAGDVIVWHVVVITCL